MIHFLTFRQHIYDNDFSEADTKIQNLLNDGWRIHKLDNYPSDSSQYVERIITMQQDQPTVPATNLVTTRLMTIQRDVTKGSLSPMWRCTDHDGEKVNIFEHDDPERDTFHLFEQAGWAPLLKAAPLGEPLNVEIAVTMVQDGDWWKVVSVERQIDELDALIEDVEHRNQVGDRQVLNDLRTNLGSLLDDIDDEQPAPTDLDQIPF